MLVSGRPKQEYGKFKASSYYLDMTLSFKKGERKKKRKGKKRKKRFPFFSHVYPCLHFNLLIYKQKFDETLLQKQNKTPSCITAMVL